MSVRTRAVASVVIGLLVGIAYPFIDVYVRCRAPGGMEDDAGMRAQRPSGAYSQS